MAKLDISIYRRENGCFENFIQIISESQGESFYIYSDCRRVFAFLNERLFTKKHSILILKIKEKLLALKKHKKSIKFL
jgi:hypothetical protein